MAHAHERGVLHRDLKPSNILWDAQLGPQVTDFGLAKLISDPASTQSKAAHMLGSPSYMAPEQTGGRLAEVTTSTDVYGIGAVLYELLSGRPPFQGKSAISTARMVVEDAPRPLENVPRDLHTVCLKCLEKNQADRYATAAALADELERFSRSKPVLAVPHSPAERLWRWAQRRPAVAALLASSALLLVSGVAGVVWQWRNAEQARAAQSLAEARASNAAKEESLARLQWQEIGRWLEEGDEGHALAYLASLIRERPERWQPAMYAMSIVEQRRFPLLAGPEVQSPVKLSVPSRLSPDGTWFATAGGDRLVKIWDTASGREALQIPQTSPVTALALASGPWKLAVATEDGALTVRTDLAGAPVILTREQAAPVLDLRFSADGSKLMARGKERVEIWSAATPLAPPVVPAFPGGIKGAGLCADGSRLLLWNAERAAVWDADTPKELRTVAKRQEFRNAVIAAGGGRFACLDGQYQARIWDVDSGAALSEVESELPQRDYMALNGAGTRLTFAGWGNEITVHDTASGGKISPVMSHNYFVDSLTPSLDGTRMFTFGLDEMLHVWDAETGRSLRAPVRLEGVRRGTFIAPSHDGRRVLIHTPARDKMSDSISLWDSTTQPPVLRHKWVGFRNFNFGSMSEDNTLGWFASDGSGPTRAHVYEIATGKVLLDVPTLGEVYSTLFPPDMTRCYIVTNKGTLHGFSLTDGQPLWPPNQQSGGIIPAALSPDGSLLVAGHSDGHVRIYTTATGKVLHEHGGLGEIRTLRFAPDGSGRFVSGGVSGLIHLWDVHTGGKFQTFTGHTGIVLSTAWSRDSLSLASASADNTARIWNVATGLPTALIMPHLAVPTHLDFSPDGSRLATCAQDGTARLWDPRTGLPVSPPLLQGLACTTVQFTADGAAFFVHDHDGFRFWDTATALPVTLHYRDPVAGGFALDSEASRHFMSPDGTRVFLAYSRNDGIAYSVSQPRGPVPAWFPDFLEMLAQLQIDPHGALRLVPKTTAADFVQKLKATTPRDAYSAWALGILGRKTE